MGFLGPRIVKTDREGPVQRQFWDGQSELAPEAYTEFGTMRALYDNGDVVLLRGDWLVNRLECLMPSERLSPLKRRQELPSDAFWTALDLFDPAGRSCAEIVAVSHSWYSREHPDPHGQQLAILHYVAQVYDRSNRQLAIFLDWCCLFQPPWTREEEDSFRRSLKTVSLWYGHSMVTTLVLSRQPSSWAALPYQYRGWTTFEQALGQLCTEGKKVLDLGVFKNLHEVDDVNDVQELHEKCNVAPKPPLLLMDLAALLRRKTFSRESDYPIVMTRYREAFDAVWRKAKTLDYEDLQWGGEEVTELVKVLPLCGHVRDLNLGGNRIDDDAMVELSSVLPRCSKLEKINLRDNRISDVGVKNLVVALEELERMQELDMANNPIGDLGMERLCRVLPQCGQLSHLGLAGTAFSDIGLEQIIKVVPHCPDLVLLRINTSDDSGPKLTQQGQEKLRATWASCAKPKEGLWM